MPPGPVARRVALAAALLLLLGAALTGLSNGPSLWSASHSAGQKVQAGAEIAFGLYALLGLVTAFTARRVAPIVLACFAMTLSVASGMFVVVWTRSSVIVGILTGAIALFVAWVIIWALRKGLATSSRI